MDKLLDCHSYICDTKDRVVLILSHFWTPINITTAREGIRKLISCGSKSSKDPTVSALSFSGEPLLWEEWISPERSSYYNHQPFLCSCKRLYPVPTILLTTSKWAYQTKEKPNLRYLYKRYKGRCQICGDRQDIKNMSIEHIYPRCKGGTKESHNVTITCKKCNCKKASIYPYKNYKGENLKPSNPYPFFNSFQNERDEWKNFLFKR
mgnify:CR=1 FL=1|tara:strand:+ start:415 stop:1035 length:621 start_codon:yes stop_codon:yes gene_type:complete